MVKNDIHEMAEKIGVKKENLEAGLKTKPEATRKAITAAYNYVVSKGKKKRYE